MYIELISTLTMLPKEYIIFSASQSVIEFSPYIYLHYLLVTPFDNGRPAPCVVSVMLRKCDDLGNCDNLLYGMSHLMMRI